MDPAIGTFTTMDTYGGSLSDPMSLHKYLFANSNPVRYSDPSGHMTVQHEGAVISIITVLASAIKTTIAIISAFIKSSYFVITTIAIIACVCTAIITSGLLNKGHLDVNTTGDIVINHALPQSITWNDIKTMIESKATSITVAREYKRDGEWHHIVARTDYRAYKSRVILRESGFRSKNPSTNFANVDIVENLVYLRTAMHRRLHTTEYHQYVFSMLSSSYNENALEQVNKTEVSITLSFIRGQLMSMEEMFPQNMTGWG